MTDGFIGTSFALLTAVSWAAGVIFFQKSGETMSPFALNFFKNAVAVLLFAVTFALWGERIWAPGWGPDLLWLMLSGVVGIGVADVLFFRSLQLLGAGRSAIVETLYSPVVTVCAFVFLGETLHLATAVGGAMIMAGIWVVGSSRSSGDASVSPNGLLSGVILGVVSVVAMGVSVVAVKPILEQHTVLWATGMRLAGGLASTFLVLPFVPRWRAEALRTLVPSSSWRFAIPGAFFGAYVALFAWIGGFKFTSAVVASYLNQTSTLFIVAGAALFLGERMTWRRVSAVLMAVSGSMLVLTATHDEDRDRQTLSAPVPYAAQSLPPVVGQ